MKIAVCVKRVPDTETRIKIGADGKSIDEAGVKFVLNPYDEYAIEEALQLKEKAGDAEVVAIALGTDASQETIRTAPILMRVSVSGTRFTHTAIFTVTPYITRV